MKKLILLLTLTTICYTGVAQEMIALTGMSFQSLNDLKSFQHIDINNAIVPLKSAQSFPSYLQHGLVLRFAINDKIFVGGSIYGTSTAARSVYEDYSGKIVVDQRLRCIGIGTYFSYLIHAFPKANLRAYSLLGTDISFMKLNVNVSVFDNPDNETTKYQTASPMAELGFEYKRTLSKTLFVTMNGGLHLNQDAMLKSDGEDSELENVNWTGGKLLIGLGYSF